MQINTQFQPAQIKKDVFSGITVALALVPEAVAFAFVAGVDPMVGLYAAFMVGFITGVIGGRPGMISGATGALAVVMVSLVSEGNAMGEGHGLYYLFLTVMLMGLFQILAGVFKLGKFIRLVPHPVMMGFVNGLAIVICMSQIGMFTEFIDGEKVFLTGTKLYLMIGLSAVVMAIMWLLPKVAPKLPAALIGIIVVSAVAIGFNLDVSTVGSFIKGGGGEGLSGGFPLPRLEVFSEIPLNLDTFTFIAPYALILAAIGLIESLMTLNLIDEITETKGNSNKECIAQGTANLVTGLFGGMGGCAMIGQSIININQGGRGRLSAIVAALGLLTIILFAGPLIEQVPIAALTGVMFMVVIGTFAWSSFRILFKIPKADAIVLILVSGLTVAFDLAVAVFAGIIVSALVFAWESAVRIRARKTTKTDGTKVYEIWGPLFFGSIKSFNSKFTPQDDPSTIEIDFKDSRVSDHSAIEALYQLLEKYQKLEKSVYLRHLSTDCKANLMKASPKFASNIIEEENDPRYVVMP